MYIVKCIIKKCNSDISHHLSKIIYFFLGGKDENINYYRHLLSND